MMAMKQDTLNSTLKFETFAAAEETLREVHSLFIKAQDSKDAETVEQCRALILKGKNRAQMIARNKKVNPVKRAEKEEIAGWFTIWLQTPDIFWDWLAIRKKSSDFQKRFASSGAAPAP